ncbi:aminotransferase class I/II-fold pyridoxal phosphate-dependent enzyme [Nocardia colli]|uniref:aminotransferase class I/II-fold pyridoxal phosphate-dependent enzyme n=1 Tax=Nocardia colli TaxID=2545717 RepID=UPI0035D5EB52
MTDAADEPIPPVESGLRPATDILLAGRLRIPAGTEALILGLEGVLLDTLVTDAELIGRTVQDVFGTSVEIPTAALREGMSDRGSARLLSILIAAGIDPSAADYTRVVNRYSELWASTRRRAQNAVLEVLADAEHRSLSIGVVSDNPVEIVRAMLAEAGLRDWIDVIVDPGPEPPAAPRVSAYLEATRRLAVSPSNCVVIDNSCAAVEAAALAGCYTIGIATGADSFDTLRDSPFTGDCVPDFTVRARLAALGFPAPAVIEDPERRESAEPDTVLPDDSFIRLDREDCPYPLPQTVAAELAEFVTPGTVRTYPGIAALRSSLADYCGVADEQILPVNGARQAIELVLRALLRPGRTMLVARPAYPYYGQLARSAGARILGVPFEEELRFPYRGFAAAAAQADLIVLINPNNPTGTGVDRDFIEQLLRAHPSTPIMVDEAYYEFTGATVADLTLRHDNLVVVRTFGKAFAMPGLRLGYLVAHPWVLDGLGASESIGVNELAVVAGQAHLADLGASRVEWTETMRVVKPLVVGGLREIGLGVLPGAANFVLVRPSVAGAVEQLRGAGILVQPMREPGLADMFRMAIGTYGQMIEVIEVFREQLRGGPME